MSTQASSTPSTIYVSQKYDEFKLMAGNRQIDYNHVKNIKEGMRDNPHFLKVNPIVVNENGYIIDGQHRHMAARELNIPLHYIVDVGGTIEQTRKINSTQRRWTLMDFATSYADSGRKDYQTFIDLTRKFSLVAPSIVRMYLAGGDRSNAVGNFRSGRFTVDDAPKAELYLERLTAIIKASGAKMTAPLSRAFWMLFEGTVTGADAFDVDVFLRKLDNGHAVDLFKVVSSVQGNLRSIEDVYNFQSATRKRLY